MIGSFGKIIFEVNGLHSLSIEKELSRIRKVKLSEHIPIYGIGSIRHQGRELTEISFSIQLISSLGISPKKELQKLYNMMELGNFNYLVIGTQVMGEFPFLIREISEKLSRYNPLFGDFDLIELEITLIEYVNNSSIYTKQLQYRKQSNYSAHFQNQEEIIAEQKEKGGRL
ncbi:MAG TPA: phage tail protein [Fusobacterium sp.]|uniref:phage tail protein n=1 Tax=Fusobacterium sp. TaxID=68766 RepID=UPI002F3ECE8E